MSTKILLLALLNIYTHLNQNTVHNTSRSFIHTSLHIHTLIHSFSLNNKRKKKRTCITQLIYKELPFSDEIVLQNQWFDIWNKQNSTINNVYEKGLHMSFLKRSSFSVKVCSRLNCPEKEDYSLINGLTQTVIVWLFI